MTLSDILLSQSSTKLQALRRLRFLKEFVNYHLFDSQKQAQFEQVFSDYQSSELEKTSHQESSSLAKETSSDLQFLKSLGEQFYQQFTIQNMNDLLDQAEKAILEAKTVIIYLPFEIPMEELQGLSSWFKKNLGDKTLMEIKFDVNLIGGPAFSYNGIYKDYSLKQKIADNKANIIDSLTSFKKQSQ